MLMNSDNEDALSGKVASNTSGFGDALRRCLENEGASCEEGGSLLRYRNLYCRFSETDSILYRSIVISIGWHGQGFQLTAAPDLEFVCEGKEWKEKSNPLLKFADVNELARFCLRQMRSQSSAAPPLYLGMPPVRATAP